MNIIQSRALHGVPAHLILIMASQPAHEWTRAELEQWSMYPDNAVLNALNILDQAGFITIHGDNKRNRAYQYSDQNPLSLPMHDKYEAMFAAKEQAPEAVADQEIPEATEHAQEESYPQGREILLLEREITPFRGDSAQYTYTTTTTDTSLRKKKLKNNEEEIVSSMYEVTSYTHAHENSPELRWDDTTQNRANWLQAAGLNVKAKPVLDIIRAGDIDLDYLAAHAMQFAYETEKLAKDHTPGLLLTRLKARDPAPIMRCQGCLQKETECKCWMLDAAGAKKWSE